MSGSRKEVLARSLGPLGGYRASKFLTRNNPRILMYHRFCEQVTPDRTSKDVFYKQMSMLKNNFNVISMSSLYDEKNASTNLGRNIIAITVDDGFRDFYETAYPILADLGLPATIYITTNFVDGKIWLWPDIVEYIIHSTTKNKLSLEFEGCPLSLKLSSSDDKSKSWTELINLCLSLSHKGRGEFIEYLGDMADVSIPTLPPDDYKALDWTEVREMSNNGITIGSHTCNHPILSKLTGKELEEEIYLSRVKIEKEIDKPVDCFCYPNGQSSDYNDEVIGLVKKHGYTNAVTAFYDKVDIKKRFEIRRHTISDNMYQYRKAIFGVKYLSTQFANS